MVIVDTTLSVGDIRALTQSFLRAYRAENLSRPGPPLCDRQGP